MMSRGEMIRNQRIADMASLLAAQDGQDRAFDEIDVDLILRAWRLRLVEVIQYEVAVGVVIPESGFPWTGAE